MLWGLKMLDVARATWKSKGKVDKFDGDRSGEWSRCYNWSILGWRLTGAHK